jgi:NADH:ubiquinone oxidoreductase subunit 2 (subunit N)
VILSAAMFISVFFGISGKIGIKRFVIILDVLSLFLALFINIYSFAVGGSFSNYLMSFGIFQVIEISIILFSAINILFFISIYNIGDKHFIKILILFMLSVCCIIFLIISRNFLLMFLSWSMFLVSVFQLITSLNIILHENVRYILRFFTSSLLSAILAFFSFSLIYGSTDFKDFRQIVESGAVSSPIVISGIIIFIIAVYLYLFLFPLQGSYLRLIKRCEHSSMAVIWFLYFPAGIFVLKSTGMAPPFAATFGAFSLTPSALVAAVP